MISKKTYTFFIKHFRLLHLIISILILMLLLMSLDINSFFARYVKNIYFAMNNFAPTNYTTLFIFLIPIIIVSLSLMIYIIFDKKRKPKNLYMCMSIYYTFMILNFFLNFVTLKSLESKTLNIKRALVFRDLSFIVLIPQIFFLIKCIIRTLGIDLKKFKFSNELKKLDARTKKDEEFEFIKGVDSYGYAKYIMRVWKKVKYYILENKITFCILSLFSMSLLTVFLSLNIITLNNTYKENDNVYINGINIKVNSSYLTPYDYAGNIIQDGKYYLILNMNFENNSGLSTVLNLSDYSITTNSGVINPTLNKNSCFIDLGTGYTKDKIENGKSLQFIIVYELNKSDIKNAYTLKIKDNSLSVGSIEKKSKKILLKPSQGEDVKLIKSINLKEKLNLNDSILNNSHITINEVGYTSKFTFNYQTCTSTVCSNRSDSVTSSKNKKLMVIDGILVIDQTSPFIVNEKNTLDFYEAFMKVNYDGNISQVKNVTLSSLKNKYILEVDEKVMDAKSVSIILTIRNKQYSIKVK